MVEFLPTPFHDAVVAASWSQSSASAVIKNSLGDTRYIVGIKNGVEFYRARLVGEVVMGGGKILDFGDTDEASKNLAVDLSNGTCYIQIEGGGNIARATIGLEGSGKDFTVPENPDGIAELAFSPAATLGSYPFIWTGIGPTAPEKARNMYHKAEYWSWPAAGPSALVATAVLDKREQNLSLQHPTYANDYGDVAVWSSTNPLVVGNFRGTLLSTIGDKSLTEAGLVPLNQLKILWDYDPAQWAGFPEATNWDMQNMVLNFGPHKIFIKDMDDNVVFIMESPGGEAINSDNFFSGKLNTNFVDRPDWGRDATHPIHPQMHIFREHFCENTDPGETTLGRQILTKFYRYRPSQGKTTISVVLCEPLLTGGYNRNSRNGGGQFYYMPKYAEGAINVTVNGDPYLEDNNRYSSFQNPNITGWGKMYAAFGTTNRYKTPGGPRFVRAAYASDFTMYFNDPTGHRLLGNVPWKEMAHAHRWNIYNDTTPHGIALADVDNWSVTGFYYWNGTTPPGRKIFRLSADQRDGTALRHYDVAGNLIMGGDGNDSLHDYKHRATQALLWKDPMAVLSATQDTIYSFMMHGGVDGNRRASFMTRGMSWEWQTYGWQWAIGSTHPRGITQAYMKDRFNRLLESNYRDNIAPAFVDNAQTLFAKGLRNLGTNIQLNDEQNPTSWGTPGGWLAFYNVDVLWTFRQTEFWHEIVAQGGHPAFVMTKVVECMDKYMTGVILDMKGAADDGYTNEFSDGSLASVPDSWADLYARKVARNDPDLVNDFQHITNFDVNPPTYGNYSPDSSAAASIFKSWAYMRQYAWAEIPSPRNAAAVAEFDRWDDLIIQRVNAASTPLAKTGTDYKYQLPCNNPRIAPTFIGRA